MPETPEFKNLLSRSLGSLGGATAPLLERAPHSASGILTVGPASHYGSFYDSITDAGGEPWIEQSEDDSTLKFLRSGLYTIHSWGYDFRKGATDFTLGQEVRCFLRLKDNPNGNPQFCWSVVKATSDDVTDGRILNSENDGPSYTLFLPKGAEVEIWRSGVASDVTVGMEFYVLPLAFMD